MKGNATEYEKHRVRQRGAEECGQRHAGAHKDKKAVSEHSSKRLGTGVKAKR